MNEIEQRFYDTFCSMAENPEHLICIDILCQQPIGIYVPDFIYGNIVVEIDGHDWHKTKEQREKDYTRERYFQKMGYIPVRFMATEVFLNPQKCVEEMVEIFNFFDFEEMEKCRDYAHEYLLDYRKYLSGAGVKINPATGMVI